MTNINDLGLPQGLPYVFPYTTAELEAKYPGITAPDADPTAFSAPREMTAADLGLSAPQGYGLSVPVVMPMPPSDAPCSFWLGAEHG